MTPSHPFFTARAAMLSPNNARRNDPPPSTTSTRPMPGSSSVERTLYIHGSESETGANQRTGRVFFHSFSLCLLCSKITISIIMYYHRTSPCPQQLSLVDMRVRVTYKRLYTQLHDSVNTRFYLQWIILKAFDSTNLSCKCCLLTISFEGIGFSYLQACFVIIT